MFFCVASIILLFLVREYSIVREHVHTLKQLKDRYCTYVTIMKSALDRQLSTEQAPEGAVRRDAAYLYDTMIQFLKNNDLLPLINRIDQDAWKEYVALPAVTVKKENPKHCAKKAKSNKPTMKKNTIILDRKSRFSWPLDPNSFWLSSPFGPRKNRDGSSGFHYGIDMAALKGTPIRPAKNGTVTEVRYDVIGYGNTIVITHDKRFKTRYAHLDKVYVTQGKTVTTNKIIGTVGETGFIRKRGKDGSHLHLEVHDNNVQVNPIPLLPSLLYQ